MSKPAGNAYPKNTPRYCLEDVIDFLDNLYDVVFMTYEANITAYGTTPPPISLSIPPSELPRLANVTHRDVELGANVGGSPARH